MERPNVPKFGQWENKGEVGYPYTAYFDKARKGRGGNKMINPNDPEEYPELYGDIHSNSSDGGKGSSMTMDDIDKSAHSNHQGSNNSRPSRVSAGSEHNSIDRSPLHPHYREKAAGVGSPAKSPHHGSQGNRTPGRSRMKPAATKDHRNEERSGAGGAPIPRFGDWDENNPESAENFTQIFNVASVEKQSGSSNTPPPSYSYPSKTPKQKPQCCCFAWLGK